MTSTTTDPVFRLIPKRAQGSVGCQCPRAHASTKSWRCGIGVSTLHGIGHLLRYPMTYPRVLPMSSVYLLPMSPAVHEPVARGQ
jgi:hypothetical protein